MKVRERYENEIILCIMKRNNEFCRIILNEMINMKIICKWIDFFNGPNETW